MTAAPRAPLPWQIPVGDTALCGSIHRADDERAIVVLVHGFGEHSGRYGRHLELLAARGVTVVTYDLRGHGASPGPRARVAASRHVLDNLSVRDAVRQRWRARADDAPVPPTVLFGHSLGGLVALESALRLPFDLAGLVLSSPALVVGERTPAPVRAAAPVLARLLPRLPVDRLDPAHLSRVPEAVAAYEEDPQVHHGPVPALSGATMLADGQRTLARSGALAVPTLLLHGSADRITSVHGSRRLAAEAGRNTDPRPELTYRELEGGYHELFNDLCADEAFAELCRWIDSRLGSGAGSAD